MEKKIKFEMSVNHMIATRIVCIGFVALLLIAGTPKIKVFHMPTIWDDYDSGHESSVKVTNADKKPEETSEMATKFPKKFSKSPVKLNTTSNINGSSRNIEQIKKQERIHVTSGYYGI